MAAGRGQPQPRASNEYSDIRWTAPGDGLVAVTGTFTGALNLGGFLSSDVHVLHNGASLFDGLIPGAADTAPFRQAFAVKAGDTIDFEVGTGPDASDVSDTTGLDAAIRFPPLHVIHDAHNVHFEINGLDTGWFMPAVAGTVQSDHRSDGCTFSLTGTGARPEVLVLGDPPKRFISNEIGLVASTRNVRPTTGAVASVQ